MSAPSRRPFPLRFWKETTEYEAAHHQATQRLEELRTALKQKGFTGQLIDIKFNDDCEPMVWCNSSLLRNTEDRLTVADAHKRVMMHGVTGYSTLSELEWFMQGRGKMYDRGMHELGFTTNPRTGRWQRGEYKPMTRKQWGDEVSHDWAMYAPHVVFDNTAYKVSQVYTVQASANGSIYAALAANIFEPDINNLSRELSQQGHIWTTQEGFTLESRNIQRGKGDAAQKYVHVCATRSDGGSVERVWPHIISRHGEQGLWQLADDLIAHVHAAKR